MSTILSDINSFWVSYGPWIGAALIPTIITGLSASSRFAADAPIVQKVWDVIKQVLDFLSLATHKDAPGTFQAPLKLSKLTKKSVTPIAGILVVIFMSSLATNEGCAWFQKEKTDIGKIISTCGTKAVSDISSQLVPAIIAASSGTALPGIVEGMIVQFGEDVTACAVSQATAQLAAVTLKATPGETSSKSLDNLHAIMQSKHWIVTP